MLLGVLVRSMLLASYLPLSSSPRLDCALNAPSHALARRIPRPRLIGTEAFLELSGEPSGTALGPSPFQTSSVNSSDHSKPVRMSQYVRG